MDNLSDMLFRFVTKGVHPKWDTTKSKLVELGVARFTSGNDTAVTIEEPVALIAVLRRFETSLKRNVATAIASTIPVSQGEGFEQAVLLSLTINFRKNRTLSDVFKFYGEIPAWAKLNARIVRRGQTEFEDGDIITGRALDPSAGSSFYAENPHDVKDWLVSKLNTWCRLGPLMGPDLITRLQLEDGRKILLLIQAKCYLTGNKDTIPANVTAKAITSITPSRFYSSLVCCSIPFVDGD